MSLPARPLVAFVALLASTAALAQGEGYDPTREPLDEWGTPQQPGSEGTEENPSEEASQDQPPSEGTEPQEEGQPAPAEAVNPALLLDGHVRSGPFLAGPGSLSFILHHSILGAAGGLVTMGIGSGFRFDQSGTREAMLAGTLIGAGAGFGVAAWWQFNNWLDSPVAILGIVNSIVMGMSMAGLMDLFTSDKPTLAWTALAGAELGAWLTVGLGGGEMPLRRTLAVSSGAGWGMIYTALLIAIIGTTQGYPDLRWTIDMLLMSAGGGALALALGGLKFDPSAAQVIRADLFGAGVGAAVLFVSALLLGGFTTATPYVLTLLASAGAIAAVSVFWVEAAERPGAVHSKAAELYRTKLYRSKDRDRPYSNPWW